MALPSTRSSRPPSPDADGTAGGPKYPIESVDNALRLLLKVARQKHVRVSDASSELGIAVSTVHRLLAMLTHYGLVAQDPASKTYHAGPELLRIGLAAVSGMNVRTLTRVYAERLRDETRETVHVTILQGQEVLFIDCAESPEALRVATRVGSLMWAHCTSAGKAWLACESDEFVRNLYPQSELPAQTPRSITTRADLLTELAQVRRRGYAASEGESDIGVGSVSAAVRDQHGKPVAGLTVSAPLVRISEQRWPVLAEAVQRVSREISASLL